MEIEAPNHKIVSETVFNDDATALSAMQGIHNQLASVPFSSGGASSVTVLAGLSSEILLPIRSNNQAYTEISNHDILPTNSRNLNLWSSAYNMIYMVNSLLEGLESSDNISESVRQKLEGEGRFIRAFTYFYLVNLYGDVPLILTTDFQTNALATREEKNVIYQYIISDLERAMDLLEENNFTAERTQINRITVIAFLGRVQLYLENWQEAENLTNLVIGQEGTYEILENLEEVFLANSKEAIWQLSPLGRGSNSTNTQEGSNFIIHPFLSFLAQLKLNEAFVDSFEETDQRLTHWIAYHQRTGYYYSHKYKIFNSTDEPTEYSMVFRLAEQYLIRAEARARQDDLDGALADLDKIRGRAGIDLIADTNPNISRTELLDLIMEERRKELFTEWGHRWLDLKRTGRTAEIFGSDPLWEETDVLYPIPEADRLKNPNLTQNDGY